MTATFAPACPAPVTRFDRVQLGHGSGGRMSAELLRARFLPHFHNEYLDRLEDAALIGTTGAPLAVSTDTFVVSPLEFAGGNIGTLAVHGTLNDIAMRGGRALYLTAGFVLEEGLPYDVLDRIVAAMGGACRAAGVRIIAGDTKVVERGKADGVFINTTGIGQCHPSFLPEPAKARAGDAILVSGAIGRHGIAIMSAREGLAFGTDITSDTANLWPLVAKIESAAGAAVHALRDPTRGGVASALNEIAASAGLGVELDEGALPVPEGVAGACEMLGLDPLYVANEGIFVAFIAPDRAAAALRAMREHPLGRDAQIIGRATAEHPRMVVLRTALGGHRIVDLLPGDQLPRIC